MTAPVALADRVHLVGIGGAGMSGIARILLARGRRVSGSDAQGLARRARAARARRAGRRSGTTRRTCPAAPATVVVSTAIRHDNPELAAARERGLDVVRRAAGAGRADGGPPARRRHRHRRQDLDHLDAHRGAAALRARPVVRDRRRPDRRPGPARTRAAATSSSPRPTRATASFLAFAPHVAVVTNVEADHLDHHGTAEAYVAVFDGVPRPDRPRRLPRRLRRRPGGRGARRPAGAGGIRVRRYGAGRARRRPAGRLPARRHRRLGRAAPRRRRAPACGWPCPASTWRSTRSPRCWPGVELGAAVDGAAGRARRRSTGCGGGSSSRAGPAGVAVYDDYAHHPTQGRRAAARGPRTWPGAGPGRRGVPAAPLLAHPAVRGRRSAPRSGWPTRWWCWTSTAPARTRSPGVTGALVAEAVPLPPERVHYVPRWAEVPAVVAGRGPSRRPGDHDGRRRRHRARSRRSCWSWSGGTGHEVTPQRGMDVTELARSPSDTAPPGAAATSVSEEST